MLHTRKIASLCCIALFLLHGGCQQSESPEVRPPSDAMQSPAALRDERADFKPATEPSRRARLEEIAAQINQAQMRHDALTQEKSRIAAQLAAHQSDSAATLEKLKTEMQKLQRRETQPTTGGATMNNSASDAFSERARNQLEHALAMDQEYQTQLTQTDGELRNLDATLHALREETKSLQTNGRN